jgi:protein transport protein SEC23
MLFVGGAASYGPGTIVGTSLSETIRTARDVKDENTNAKYMKAALVYYNALAAKAILNGHAVDVFCCSIDQMGLMEMRNLPDKTGGYMLLTDSFTKDEFKLSI